MPGPPPNVTPEDLWLKLSERERPTTEIDFPAKGKDGKPLGRCKIRVLTEAENHLARGQADIAAREIMKNGAPKPGEFSYGYEDIYRNELAVQLVALAFRNVENQKFGLFPSAKDVRNLCTTDELGVMSSAYQQFRVEAGPLLSEMTPDEMEAWLARLQEGGASFGPLVSWDGVTLRQFIKFLVSKAPTSSTATGSAGSPPSDTSQEVAVPASEMVDPADVAKPE
jgi:hypothetical protein